MIRLTLVEENTGGKIQAPLNQPDAIPVGRTEYVTGIVALDGPRLIRSAVTIDCKEPLP
jgi:hypothetical protein